jgi:hypothetical protein
VSFEYSNPIITQLRKGTVDSPFVSKSENHIIADDGKVVLTELPDKFNKVKVSGASVTWVEVADPDQVLGVNEYHVDYLNKIVTFNISRIGLQLLFEYQGRGLIYVPTSMVYLNSLNGEVTQVLSDLTNNASNFTSQGTYNAATTYEPFNIVSYLGSSYLCILQSTGNLPTNSTYWTRISGYSWKGTYSTVSTYINGDTVVNAENTIVYQSKTDANLNNLLTDTTHWQKIIDIDTTITAIEAAEANRVTAENSRVNAEDARVTAESGRVTVENSRVTNENTRQTSETTRQTNETAREAHKNSWDFLGEYNNLTAYIVNNQVRYNGTTYICILGSTGNLPTDTLYWDVYAQKGLMDTIASTNSDITVGGTSTDPTLTLNSGASASQIVKRNASGNIDDVVTVEAQINDRQIENIGYGVHDGLNVLESATPDMNVHVQTGVVYMPNGQRFEFNTINVITVTTADATNPRKDIVYVDSVGVISYLAGVADPAPVKPALPSGAVELREIDVPAGDTAIEQAQLIDTRIFKDNLPDVKQQVTSHLADIANPHGVTASQAGAEPAFTKNSAFNKNFGTTAGTVLEGNARAALVAKAGDTMTGLLQASSFGFADGRTYIPFPKGGAYGNNTSNLSGAIKVTLPVSWTSTMLRFAVDIFEYSTNKSFTVYVSGYNYNSGYWVNVSAYTIGKSGTDKAVRLGHDGTKCCIWIGETNNVWQYPQVYVRDLEVGFGSYALGTWDDGWSISIVTAFNTINQTLTGNMVDAGTLDGYASATAGTANTHALRDGSGDIHARLFRSEYDTTNGTIGYIMTQIDTATNNYLRPSTPAQVRTGLGVPSANNVKQTVSSTAPSGNTTNDLWIKT